MRSVRRNFAYNTLYQVVRVLAPLITMPYISRVLGPDGAGFFSYTQSIASYFVMFAILGMSKYGVREIARAKDRAERSDRFWNIYLSQIVVAVIVSCVYFAYCATLDGLMRTASLAWGLYVLSEVIDVSWLFFGSEDFKPTAISGALLQVLQVVLIFLFVRSDADVWLYCLFVAGYYFCSQAVLWPFVKNFVGWARPSWKKAKRHIVPSLRLFLPVIAISMYSYLDSIILGQMSTMAETGYYQYSYSVSTVPLSLITALGTVMLPKMSAVFADDDTQQGIHLIRLSLWVMLAAAFAFGWGIASVTPEFVPVYFGDSFLPAIPTMILLSAILPIIATSNVLGIQYMIPRLKDNQYTASLCFGAVVNVVMSLALVPRFGAFGSAIGTIGAEGAVTVVQAVLVRKELPLGRFIKDMVPHCAIGFAMALVIRLAAAPLCAAVFGAGVVGLLVEVAIGAVVYVVLELAYCIGTKNALFYEVFGGYLPASLSSSK